MDVDSLMRLLCRRVVAIDSCFVGEDFDGAGEVHVLVKHDEGEYVASGRTGAEASPALSFGGDDERRGALGVKGAVGFVPAAAFGQREIVGQDICDVETGVYVVNDGHVKPVGCGLVMLAIIAVCLRLHALRGALWGIFLKLLPIL